MVTIFDIYGKYMKKNPHDLFCWSAKRPVVGLLHIVWVINKNIFTFSSYSQIVSHFHLLCGSPQPNYAFFANNITPITKGWGYTHFVIMFAIPKRKL